VSAAEDERAGAIHGVDECDRSTIRFVGDGRQPQEEHGERGEAADREQASAVEGSRKGRGRWPTAERGDSEDGAQG
jgi:hypothetical protein